MTNTDEFVSMCDKVRDELTGVEGIVCATTRYLNGCRRICIQPQAGDDGKLIDSIWADEPQLSVIERSAYQNPVQTKTSGGDRPDAPRR